MIFFQLVVGFKQIKLRSDSVDNQDAMSYQKIFELKFKKGYSTQTLMKRFPKEASKIREIALLQIPTPLLKEAVFEGELLEKVLALKKKFFGALS